MSTTPTDELLTPKQMADELQLHIATVWRYIREGKLQALRLNSRNVRIRRSELDRFLRERESA